MKKFLFLLPFVMLLMGCGNKAVGGNSAEKALVDSLRTENALKGQEIAKKSMLIDSLRSVIAIKDSECQSHEKKLKQYEQLVEDYHDVVYAIVGEDGLYNYELEDRD